MDALRSSLIALVVVLGACDVGEVPAGGPGPDGGTGGTQAQKFDTVIKPLVTRCAACHGTTQAPNFTSYQTLDAKYRTPPGASNILVTKADPTQGMHEGIQYLSAQDKMTVASWIDGK
jgi:cytochrome c553